MNEETQEILIKQLCKFIQSENPDQNQIDKFPFPFAIFKRNGVLSKANRALAMAAGITAADLEMGCINFLNRITTENEGVLDASERVFRGETRIVRDLVAPVSMFAREDFLPDCCDEYQTALFFPVGSNTDEITCGAVALMREPLVD